MVTDRRRGLLVAVFLFAGVGCSSTVGSGDPTPQEQPSATPSSEASTPTDGSSELRELCDRFEANRSSGDREAWIEAIQEMAAGEDPRPESHESFFGADRKIWLWAQLALRANEQRDRPGFRAAIRMIAAQCETVG